MNKRKITEIVPCHHEGRLDDNWSNVDRASRKAGSLAGPYHYFIDVQGVIWSGRPLDWPSGHHTDAAQANSCVSIGINIPKGNKWNARQRKAFEEMVSTLRKGYPKIALAEVHGLPMEESESESTG